MTACSFEVGVVEISEKYEFDRYLRSKNDSTW